MSLGGGYLYAKRKRYGFPGCLLGKAETSFGYNCTSTIEKFNSIVTLNLVD